MDSLPTRGALEASLGAARARRAVEAALARVFSAWGYTEVSVPYLQPADGGDEWGGVYRVLDQDGAVLALRPDMTGPIARLSALGDAGGPRPRRLSYLGTLFRRGNGSGPREVEQVGAELIGAGGPVADAEVLALTAEALSAAGLPLYRLSVGHVGVVRQILERSGCGDSGAASAFRALRERDFVGLRSALAGAPGLFEALTWRGSVAEAVSGAGPLPADGAGAAFVQTLAMVADLGLGAAVEVELGLVRPGTYYSGLVFEVSAPAVARSLGGGGRYDGLLGRWGPDEPAIGFALSVEEVLSAAAAGERSGEGAPLALVVPDPGCERRAWRVAAELRSQGRRVALDAAGRGLDGSLAYASALGCAEVLQVTGRSVRSLPVAAEGPLAGEGRAAADVPPGPPPATAPAASGGAVAAGSAHAAGSARARRSAAPASQSRGRSPDGVGATARGAGREPRRGLSPAGGAPGAPRSVARPAAGEGGQGGRDGFRRGEGDGDGPASDGLTLALPRGRLWPLVQGLLVGAALPGASGAGGDRQLVWSAEGWRYLLARPGDVLTYVREGVADAGVTGKDVLLEDASGVYELLDLGIGRCRLMVAVPEGVDWPGLLRARGDALRIATKYPRAAREYFARRGVSPHILRLAGAVELAPQVGLADAIVDLVETGRTLAANGLREVETVAAVSSRLIANQRSYRWRSAALRALARALTGGGAAASGAGGGGEVPVPSGEPWASGASGGSGTSGESGASGASVESPVQRTRRRARASTAGGTARR